ncbi:D-aminoacyl-tRNA deacylase isoform X1 [Maniola jurtina]|uniref:D-aminoacyl-tRNA deacylase isoform X1 n=1 Tax=Maniola jurtina TaxID=191418 RepID=UPI001E68A954|nr:D-aminoacyl-tRNA deacylase isoform X1 [Maniola jurtina]
MKAIIQRVMNAKVSVNGEIVSSIGQGALVFIGICSTDNAKDMEYMVRKILSIRIFDDENEKKWKKSLVDNDFEVLCVSQFTLYNTWKGLKPDFHLAMPSEHSKEFYENFIEMLKSKYKPDKVKDGIFGAYMQVSLQNDGPVTLEIESPAQPEKTSKKTKSAHVNKTTEDTGDLAER